MPPLAMDSVEILVLPPPQAVAILVPPPRLWSIDRTGIASRLAVKPIETYAATAKGSGQVGVAALPPIIERDLRWTSSKEPSYTTDTRHWVHRWWNSAVGICLFNTPPELSRSI